MSNSKKITGLLLLVALVGIGAVLYFGFFKGQPQQTAADTNKTPASRSPAKEHILGLADSQTDLNTFMKAEYDRQNVECKQKNPNTELAMGMHTVLQDKFAVASLGCGETGTSGYYARVNGAWQLAFKAEETPTCDDVNRFKYTKEIAPECITGGVTTENTNP